MNTQKTWPMSFSLRTENSRHEISIIPDLEEWEGLTWSSSLLVGLLSHREPERTEAFDSQWWVAWGCLGTRSVQSRSVCVAVCSCLCVVRIWRVVQGERGVEGGWCTCVCGGVVYLVQGVGGRVYMSVSEVWGEYGVGGAHVHACEIFLAQLVKFRSGLIAP
jgi:hypothetical protein